MIFLGNPITYYWVNLLKSIWIFFLKKGHEQRSQKPVKKQKSWDRAEMKL